MNTGQRIDIIRKIAGALEQRLLSDSNLILRSFGCRTWTEFDISTDDYYIDRVESLESGVLVDLHEYLFPGESLPVTMINNKSTLWKEGFVKAFISHSTKQKLFATQIKKEAIEFGIDCFVAHEDIEPSKEWMREIRYALATCDCTISLLTKDFRASNYCDQEIGFVLQRGILIIPISIEMDPYGFIAPFQRVTAFEKSPTEITEEIRALISRHDSLAAVAKAGLVSSQVELIQTFLSSSNFSDSTSLLKKIETLTEIPVDLLEIISDGWQQNDQIYGCNGIPSRMTSLFRKHGFKEKKK